MSKPNNHWLEYADVRAEAAAKEEANYRRACEWAGVEPCQEALEAFVDAAVEYIEQKHDEWLRLRIEAGVGTSLPRRLP